MGGWGQRVLLGAALAGCDVGVHQSFEENERPRTPAESGSHLFVDELPAPPCLPRRLATGSDGSVDCELVEVRVVDAGGRCAACESDTGRGLVSENVAGAVRQRLEALARCGGDTGRNCSGPSTTAAGHCQCKLNQLSGEDAVACRNDPEPPVSGWCYVDPANGLGDPAIVASCSGPSPRMLRFVGSAAREDGVWVFVVCAGIAAR
jgi:hypothetical protein